MVARRTDMKRKRKDTCGSPILDDSPKRTRVHAQRKFAQGSNVNSPIITPIKELEAAEYRSPIDILPEPVELLPIKRPETELFLTFLSLRGTPILPPSYNFFNTASIVDTNGQVHEIKSESSAKNGPIDISKCASGGCASGSSTTDKPFIAYGVRKRADPIVISRQMDRKRRHALAIQALRRKYQEQKMAKIRALTISKLSEKVTNKTLVRSTNSVSKTETVTKKTNTIQKTKVKVVATTKQHVKVTTTTTQTLQTSLRPKIKPKMCLRSFRGRFVQRELQFRKRPLVVAPVEKKSKGLMVKKSEKGGEEPEEEKTALEAKRPGGKVAKSTVLLKKPLGDVPGALGSRVTRSGQLIANPLLPRRPQIKKRILLTTSKTIVKPRSLRSTTIKKTVISQKKSNTMQIKKQQKREDKPVPTPPKLAKKPTETLKTESKRAVVNVKKMVMDVRKETKQVIGDKCEVTKVEVKKDCKSKEVKKVTKSADVKLKEEPSDVKKETDNKQVRMSCRNTPKEVVEPEEKTETNPAKKTIKKEPVSVKKEVNPTKKEQKTAAVQKKDSPKKPAEPSMKLDETKKESPVQKKKPDVEKEAIAKKKPEPVDVPTTRSSRPSRKTKEAAAIYMELLSQKLVLDSKIDDEDDESIDSFPELPNVKKTEQRENELKAQAKKEDKVIEASPEIVMESSRKSPKLNREELIAKLVSEKTKATRASLESMSLSKKRKSNEADGASTVKLRRSDPPKKSQGKSTEEESELNRRQTRNATYSIKIRSGDDDSDESFHADIKVPRQKKFTRSKALKHKEDSEEEQRKPKDSVVLPEIPVKKPESSDSDQSTTSDINLKVLQTKTKKKFSKTKSITSKTVESRFSDSDEEPLSKLTLKSGEGSREVLGKSAGKLEQAPVKTEGKPKRECAKRPQNYLAMLSTSSSSLEDDLVEETDEGCFLGFEAKPSEVPLVVQEAHPPLSDLLSKDISRRFGKGKVNMSKEQIEKWLKESAMAGVKNENDDMLKFGERIPTETTLEQTKSIDTQKLKTTLLAVGKSEVPGAARTSPKNLKLNLAKPAVDRKLIFRKDKKLPLAPNVNAFSPENESSVYAFGEENEEAVSGPFRRPSRRPSSTATSRSEEQEIDVVRITPGQFRKPNIKIQDTPTPKTPSTSAKDESEGDDNVAHFYIPQNPTKYQKKFDSVPNSPQQTKAKLKDAEEFKYKIPSSPSASSSSSAYISKRETLGKLLRNIEVIKVQKFPCGVGQMVEAPVFHPTEQEFQDPIEYIERIKHKAEQFGICRIVPPSSFKPECKVTDDMRFTAYNQYVHKMLHRWGPNFKELMAIQKYLETQNISLTHAPWIGGMEIDLPRLYQTVQTLGGLKEVIEKKKWPRVSELMKIPKSAQDRVTKLDDIYCKYLLPYDTLSPAEREKLFDEVETDWAKRESKTLLKAQQNIVKTTEESEDDDSDDDEVEECIVKGRNMALNAFYRIARNTMSMHFKTVEPPAHEVEQEFWKHVTLKQNHICVHSGSIDCGNWGYGFAVSKNSPFARHAWNLKVLTNNSGSILRSLGPIMGVTVPTLHVGMVFSACCWYRDPHGLPWIEYLHTGGQKIWYGVPNSESDVFRMALKKLVPNYCRNKELWLPSDTAMIPPSILVENQVSLCRTVQEPGQFVVVFPKVFTSSVSTGYVVSESVYFAPPYWLKTAKVLFDDLQSSCEPPMFSLERLVLSIANDPRTNVEVLRQIIPLVQEICDKEKELRGKLRGFGEVQIEKIPLPQAAKRKRKRLQGDDGDYECEACRKNLFVSMVFDTEGDATYCLEHSISLLNDKKIILKNCKLMFTYDSDELSGLVGKIHTAIECKLQKKLPNKYAGMPTLLTK